MHSRNSLSAFPGFRAREGTSSNFARMRNIICGAKLRKTPASGNTADVLPSIDGVLVPYLGLGSMRASKETYREKDSIDLLYLRDQQAL